MTLTAMILAAGRSRRFREAGFPHKLGVPVAGLPLMAYPLISLSLINVDSLVIVVNNETRSLVSDVMRVLEEIVAAPPRVDVVVNNRPERGNGYSFVRGVEEAGLRGCVLVSMADHIYPPSLAEELLAASGPSIGVDSQPLYINVEEATRIAVSSNRITAIGKHLAEYAYIDIGVHRIPAEAAYMCGDVPGRLEFSAVLECMARGMEVRLVDVRGAPWTEIDTPLDMEELVSGSRRRVLDEVIREWRARGVEPG